MSDDPFGFVDDDDKPEWMYQMDDTANRIKTKEEEIVALKEQIKTLTELNRQKDKELKEKREFLLHNIMQRLPSYHSSIKTGRYVLVRTLGQPSIEIFDEAVAQMSLEDVEGAVILEPKFNKDIILKFIQNNDGEVPDGVNYIPPKYHLQIRSANETD